MLAVLAFCCEHLVAREVRSRALKALYVHVRPIWATGRAEGALPCTHASLQWIFGGLGWHWRGVIVGSASAAPGLAARLAIEGCPAAPHDCMGFLRCRRCAICASGRLPAVFTCSYRAGRFHREPDGLLLPPLSMAAQVP